MLLLLIISVNLFPQSELIFDVVEEFPELKNGSCGTNTSGDYAYYYDPNTWIPRMDQEPLHNSPIKYIQLNINVFQRSDGTGNFQDTPQDKQVLIDFVNTWNSMYSSIAPTSDPFNWVEELPNRDSRIRFDIGQPGSERIYFYRDDALFEEYRSSNLLNHISSIDPDRLNNFNLLLTEGYYIAHIHSNITVTNGGSGYTSPPTVSFSGNGSGAQATAHITNGVVTSITLNNNCGVNNNEICDGSYSGGRNSVSISISGGGGTGATATCYLEGGANGAAIYPSFSSLSRNMYFYVWRCFSGYSRNTKVFAHEMGHNLDLVHTFESYYCNADRYLPDVYGLTFPGTCPLDANSADAFLVNGDGITNNLMNYNYNIEYLSPMQVGIMHRSLALSSMRRYVKDCYSSVPLVITNTQTWDFDIRFYRDIEINQNGEINIDCRVLMPNSGKIIINNGGKLTIDGNITTNNSDTWNGVIVNNGGVVELTSSTVSNYCITVKSGGTLKIPDNAVLTVNNNGKIEIEAGGYICIEPVASITLQDFVNVINLRNGYLAGVNPSVPGLTGNCTSDPPTYTITGNGSINTFETDLYIQNQTFTANEYFSGINIFAGQNVTTSKPQGPVTIQNGSNVIFDRENEVQLKAGFEVKPGATFEIKQK